MKIIGVLGGIGPQATMDFEARVHAVSQRLIPPQANSGYPPMAVYYHRRPPVLTTDGVVPVRPIQPDPVFLDAARKLGALADFLVITSNGAHILQEEIEEAAGCKVLSMVDLVLKEIERRATRRVGVLAFINPTVYAVPLGGRGFQVETIPEELAARLDKAILAVMEGRESPQDRQVASEAVEVLRSRGADTIILGCTEIPFLLPGRADQEADLINPARLLAEAAVRYAIE